MHTHDAVEKPAVVLSAPASLNASSDPAPSSLGPAAAPGKLSGGGGGGGGGIPVGLESNRDHVSE